jgi:hypothetical protein
MTDKLSEVLLAIDRKERSLPLSGRRDFTLIAYHHLSERDAQAVRSVQSVISMQFGIESRVVGGGYGCSTIEIEIAVADPEERRLAVLQILESEAVQTTAREGGFVRLIIREPYEGKNLITGELDAIFMHATGIFLRNRILLLSTTKVEA